MCRLKISQNTRLSVSAHQPEIPLGRSDLQLTGLRKLQDHSTDNDRKKIQNALRPLTIEAQCRD